MNAPELRAIEPVYVSAMMDLVSTLSLYTWGDLAGQMKDCRRGSASRLARAFEMDHGQFYRNVHHKPHIELTARQAIVAAAFLVREKFPG